MVCGCVVVFVGYGAKLGIECSVDGYSIVNVLSVK